MKILKKIFISILLLFCLLPYTFAKKEKEYPKPVVISFYAKNCDECKILEQKVQDVQTKYASEVDFVKINFDSDDCDIEHLKAKYNIKSAPTTIFINSKVRITKKLTGDIPKDLYIKNVKSIIK